jgi:hypothetical protein
MNPVCLNQEQEKKRLNDAELPNSHDSESHVSEKWDDIHSIQTHHIRWLASDSRARAPTRVLRVAALQELLAPYQNRWAIDFPRVMTVEVIGE